MLRSSVGSEVAQEMIHGKGMNGIIAPMFANW